MEGENKFLTFFVSTNFTEFKINKFFEHVQKQIRVNCQRIFLTQTMLPSSQNYGLNLGTEIGDPEKTFTISQIQIQGSKKYRIRI
jgi:hypothetical protein